MEDEAQSPGAATATKASVHWATRVVALLLALTVPVWISLSVHFALDPDPKNNTRNAIGAVVDATSGAAWGAAAYQFWMGRKQRWLWLLAPIPIFVVLAFISAVVNQALGHSLP